MTLAGLSAALGKAESCPPNTIQRTQTLLTGACVTRPEKKHKQHSTTEAHINNKHDKAYCHGCGKTIFLDALQATLSQKMPSAYFGRFMDQWQIQEQQSDFLLLTQHVLPVILRLPLTRLCAHCPKPQPPAGFGCPGPRMSHQSRAGKNPTNMLSSIYLIPWVLSKQAAISWPRWPLHCKDQATFS